MNKKKKIIIIIFAVLVALLILFAIIDAVISKIEKSDSFWNNKPVVFYPVDYSLNILEYEDYLELDRTISYTKDGVTSRIILESDAIKCDEYSTLFYYYFDAMIHGEGYIRNYYSKDFKKEHEVPSEYTMQQIYNIEITYIKSEETSDNIKRAYFKVVFSIHENNGTFWKNLGSDASRPLLFTIDENLSDVDIRISDIEWLEKLR